MARYCRHTASVIADAVSHLLKRKAPGEVEFYQQEQDRRLHIYKSFDHSILLLRIRRIAMDSKRAKEICASPRMANVTHIGVPIYIDSVSNDNTANVHPLSQPDDHRTVSLSSLTEAPK